MRFRPAYHDYGLVFAKEPTASGRRKAEVLGAPLQVSNIANREFASLIAASGVPRISIHGLRHTSASLLLAAGVQPNIVQRRLGHKDISTTLVVLRARSSWSGTRGHAQARRPLHRK